MLVEAPRRRWERSHVAFCLTGWLLFNGVIGVLIGLVHLAHSRTARETVERFSESVRDANLSPMRFLKHISIINSGQEIQLRDMHGVSEQKYFSNIVESRSQIANNRAWKYDSAIDCRNAAPIATAGSWFGNVESNCVLDDGFRSWSFPRVGHRETEDKVFSGDRLFNGMKIGYIDPRTLIYSRRLNRCIQGVPALFFARFPSLAASLVLSNAVNFGLRQGIARCLGSSLHRSALRPHCEQSVTAGNIAVVPRFLRDLNSLKSGLGTLLCRSKLKVGDESTYETKHYQRSSKAGNGDVRTGLQRLRSGLSGLKIQYKLSVVLFSAFLFGSMSFRYLSRGGNESGLTNKVNIVLAALWYLIAQVVIYLLAVWTYSDL